MGVVEGYSLPSKEQMVCASPVDDKLAQSASLATKPAIEPPRGSIVDYGKDCVFGSP